MEQARVINLAASLVVLTVTGPASVEDGADSMLAVARARAETPPPPAVDRPDLSGMPVPTRLFYMSSYDLVRCVRSIADVTGGGHHEVIVGS